jgi:hypothetical protein
MDTHTHEYMIMHSSLAEWAGVVTTPSIPVLRAHFANLLAQGYLSLALILLSIFSFIRALAHELVVCMRYIFIHAHVLEHAK